MNTIRDRIPVEALLRQYIDESTEYITKEPEVKPEPKLEAKVETKVEPKPEPKVEPVIEVISIPETCPIPQPTLPVFKGPDLKTEEPKQKLSFNPEIETFDLPPLETQDDEFKIGEDVPLNTLCFDEMDKGETLDLGIVEL
jgi:hypothetical protein